MTLEQIYREASGLPESERGELASYLIDSLPGSDYSVSDAEALERKRELDSGEVEDISFDELKAGLNLPAGR